MYSFVDWMFFDFLPFDQACMSEFDWFQSDIALGIICLGRMAITLEMSNNRLLEGLTYRQQQSKR